jgi:hypothetical protein
MTSSEFSKWWADLTTRFPNMSAWLKRCFAGEQEQREFLRTWVSVMADVNLADALDVNRQMQAGDLPFVGDFHEQDIPAHVRRLARKAAWESRPRTNEQVEHGKPSSFPAGKILRRMAELARLGFNREDAMAQALKDFPIGKPAHEPRYGCHLCLDVGSVLVAPPWAITAMLEDRFEKCRHRNSSARCKCRPALPQNSRWRQATYDAKYCYRIDDPLWPDSQVDDFRAWCEAKREEFWNSKREPAFDAFNRKDVYA